MSAPASPGCRPARHQGLRSAVAFAVGVLLTACGLTSPAPPPVENAPGGEPTAASACAGVSGCKLVARTDVDGDGQPDQVGLVTQGLNQPERPGSVSVRAHTDSGRLLTMTSRAVWWYGKPASVWAGAAELDDRAGAELVVGQTMGVHTLQYRVLTYRDGRLVTLKAPRLPAKVAKSQDTGSWTVDGSYSFQTGVARSVERGQVYVTLTSAERNSSGRGHTGWTVRYRAVNGTWQLDSMRKVRYRSDEAATKVGGWHLPGIRRLL